ncbi:MAG: hypothetical protein K2L76_02600 [Muribaculaceae bacterium]|nr:hypothetical protein [Muribaculaceae bacterium]
MRKHLFVTLLLTCGLPFGYSFSAYAEPVPQTQNQNVATITGTILDEKSNIPDTGETATFSCTASGPAAQTVVKIPEKVFPFQKYILTLNRTTHTKSGANIKPSQKALKNRHLIKSSIPFAKQKQQTFISHLKS